MKQSADNNGENIDINKKEKDFQWVDDETPIFINILSADFRKESDVDYVSLAFELDTTIFQDKSYVYGYQVIFTHNSADFYFSSLSVTVPKFFVYLKEKDYDYLFPDLNDFIFKNIDNTANYDSLVKLFLVKNSIDTMDYFYFKPTTEEYRKLKANADFLKQNNIYSTLTLIINDTVYNEPNLLDILKNKLENACKD